eukprot:2317570-Amphidinium_carterae.1
MRLQSTEIKVGGAFVCGRQQLRSKPNVASTNIVTMSQSRTFQISRTGCKTCAYQTQLRLLMH